MRIALPSALVLCLLAPPVLAQIDPPPVTPAQEQRVESLLGQLSLEEKIDLLGGVDGFFIRDVPRLGLPRLKMADGPLGVRNFGPATAMAGGISLAATWDPELAKRVGTEIGRDARAKGVHFLLGPGVNLYRAPMNGRNFEYLGEDPWLASRIAVAYIEGVQSQGVSATIKHFMGNSSEFRRHDTDSVIDARTLREIYLPVFEAAVKEAHVGAVMDSYNLTNGEHMSQSRALNVDVLKKDWGFDGVLMSDWFSTYDGVAAANGGLDLEMPSAAFMNRETLLPALRKGTIQQATIDDKVRRILRTAVRFGWLDRDQLDLGIPRFNHRGDDVALAAAQRAMVLLKNQGDLLPLERGTLKTVAVIGPDAYPAVPVGGGSAHVEPFVATSILQGLSDLLAGTATVTYDPGLPSLSEMATATRFSTAKTGGKPGLKVEYYANENLEGTLKLVRTEPAVDMGPSAGRFPEGTQSERWTGYFTPPAAGSYEIFVRSTGEDGGFYRLRVDGMLLLDNWTEVTMARSALVTLDAEPHKVVLEHRGRSRWLGSLLQLGIVDPRHVVRPEAVRLAKRADAVVLAVGFDPGTESEGSDRTFALPPGQDQLIQELAAANPKSIVAITSGGGVDMRAWVDRVPAIVEAWYPGQAGGRALAQILLGDVDPSGRLPVTFERRFEDNPVHDSYYPAAGSDRVVYSEGVFVGYRGYEKNGTAPLFPFGYGLSYTSFAYANLAIDAVPGDGPRYRVSFDVTNTGKRAGADVAQVYVAEPHATVPRPPKELKGFARVALGPGETRRVSLTLGPRAFSFWDVANKGWHADPGDFEILVGRSSADVVLRETVKLPGGKP